MLNKPSKKPLPFPLKVAARSSNLSKAQCQEVLDALKKIYLSAAFTPIFRETTGDLHQHVSLRHLEKTDFFYKGIRHACYGRRCKNCHPLSQRPS